MNSDELLVLKAKKAKSSKDEAKAQHDDLISKLDTVNALIDSLGVLKDTIESIQSPDIQPLVDKIAATTDKMSQIDFGQVDISGMEKQITKLAKHVQGIELAASRPNPAPQVTVNEKDYTKVFVSLEKTIESINRSLNPSQSPEDFVPYRRVIFDGKFQFDDTRTSAGGVSGGGGGVSIDLPTWGIARIDDATDPAYYGFENNGGDWYILKEDDAAGTWKYFAGSGGINTNWAGRAGYTYGDKGTIF